MASLDTPLDRKPTLLYFNIPGRAFVNRIALFHAFGKDGWVDKTFTFSEYGAAKKAYLEGRDSILSASKSVPQIILSNGDAFAEAVPISQWTLEKGIANGNATCKLLYPAGAKRLLVNETISIIYGATNAPGGDTKEEKKAAREKYAAGPLKMYLQMYEDRLKKFPGPFILGSQISLADLWARFTLDMIDSGNFDYIPRTILDAFPLTKKNLAAVNSSAVVTDYTKAYGAK
jgi:glutathione S-transferase